MVGHFPLTIEVPDAIATQVLNQLFYELPVDDLPKYRERVLKVTPDEIQRVARWFIRPSQLSVVLVGDADKFVNDLKGVGFGTFERIPIERLDLMSADLTEAAGSASTRVTRLLLSCGEASGDLYAGALVEALRRREPDIDVFGLGGERFAAAGGRLIADFHGLSRHRPDRSAQRDSAIDRDAAASWSRRRGSRSRTRSSSSTIPDFNFRLDAAASRSWAFRSSITSARSCGRGGRAASS